MAMNSSAARFKASSFLLTVGATDGQRFFSAPNAFFTPDIKSLRRDLPFTEEGRKET